MLTAELDFKYPDSLVATQAVARGKSRILKISRQNSTFQEITWENLLATFKSGDTLVLNDSQVLWARLAAKKKTGKIGEVFFLRTLTSESHWEVLTKALKLSVDDELFLPGALKAKVLVKGRVSEIQLQQKIDLKKYFEEHGEVPLPPYITALREKGQEDQAQKTLDRARYQNTWAKVWGSVAAPTAGLHFSQEHLQILKLQGVKINYVTLHVGAGTFLPLDTEQLSDFRIHPELVKVEASVCRDIRETQAAGKRVWACGTTVLRALESAVWASGTAETNFPQIVPFFGETKLFITPGYRFRVVEGLLTNFHQPRSSLLALAAAFATLSPATSPAAQGLAVKKILDAYGFAIQKKFRLFSFGDLTVMV